MNKSEVRLPQFSINKLRVLVVEDNAFSQDYAVDALKDWDLGIQVDVAENGLEAINKLKENMYDLILMDVQMPVMDGVEATRIIRTEFPFPKKDVTIIAVTAQSSPEDLNRFIQCGMNDYFIKPYEVEHLLSKVINTLSEKVSRIGNVFDVIPDIFVIVDEDGVIHNYNKNFLLFFSLEKKMVSKKNIYSILPLPEAEEMKAVIQNANAVTSQLIKFKRQEKWVSFEVSVNELKYLFDQKKGYVLLYRDITEREEKLELEKEKELIERSLQFRTQFLANISHEIRTPLNAIVGMVEYLSEQRFTKEQTENINIIRSASQQLHSVVTDVLHLSRLEAGKYELIPRKNYLPEVVEGCFSWFKALFSDKKIDADYFIRLNYQKALFFDDSRLKQVLSNLISNAIKFSELGSKIKIKITQIDEDEMHIVFKCEIEDQGKGIGKEDQKKLFSIFGKIEDEKNYEGAGLGLIISAKIVELFGGEIGVESELGKGSAFWFTIRAQKYNEEIHSSEKMPEKFAVPKLKILFADDKKVNQKITEQVLRKIKADVDIVNNGKQVLEKVEGNEYDIILMDIRMPVMDGVSASKRLKEKYKETCPFIIGISANAMEGDEEFYLKQGMDAYMSKPFTLEKFTNVYADFYLKK